MLSEDTKVGRIVLKGLLLQDAYTTRSRSSCRHTTQDIIIRTVEYAKTVAHYGWIPLILWVGYTNSTPRPNLIK
ncbi:BZ3500_MvSof-1268-A1-R1_Chr5-2g08041 [Microbotryum saponariae]|uniref:BZ3500_MvSof-1268-A1-R1_Chr5-2g08041 protein n=1 Tax=Microbotryum saponariae TaxID=289078 RepID=A0A2X0LA43_9BASI|nr:BZ3500_MvSof-1268-A1-R1_Chr5-2g08041 [Microbotryum saponariae]SDA05910.1 BZ3501_MvSof-1269-A2-R1_Chr5-2g07863 [Microbotryum saponariae]